MVVTEANILPAKHKNSSRRTAKSHNNTLLDMASQPVKPITFMDLPGELRNSIYDFYFSLIFADQKLDELPATCRRVQSLKPALAILSTSRLIRSEATPIFWIDHVQRCHWSFGAHCDEDDRMVQFCNAARKHTLDLDITFQKRNINTTNLSANIVWLVLQSTSALSAEDVDLRKLREEWDRKHQIWLGFVWIGNLDVGSRERVATTMRYTYNSIERSWVMFRGCLLAIDWGGIFALAEAGEKEGKEA